MPNAGEWSKAMIPWYAKPFVRVEMGESMHRLDNHRALAAYQGPLLLLVGDKDSQTPASLSRRMHASAASPASLKRLYVAPGRGHTSLIGEATFADHYAWLLGHAAAAR
jgi:pimeloyl-ACP methyl ester carboxylesterase